MKHLLSWMLVLIAFSVSAQGFEVGPIQEDKLTSRLYHTRFLDNRTLAFSGLEISGVHFIDLSKLKINRSILGVEGRVDKFEFSEDRKGLLMTSFENEIVYWDLKQGKAIHSVGTYDEDYGTDKEMYFAPGDSTFGVFLGCYYMYWSRSTGKRVDSLFSPANECMYVLAHTADGKRVYAGGNHNVWYYDQANRDIPYSQSVSDISVVTDIALSPDEKRFAVGAREGLILMGPDLSQRIDLKGHTDWIREIAFSPDGKYLYSCSGTLFGTDRSVRVWDATTGDSLATMLGHQDDANALTVSPDGKWIATASSDHTLKIWSTARRELVCTIVPMKIDGTLKLFYYTPTGLLYGPDEFYSLVSIQKNGEKISGPTGKSAAAKKALRKLFK